MDRHAGSKLFSEQSRHIKARSLEHFGRVSSKRIAVNMSDKVASVATFTAPRTVVA